MGYGIKLRIWGDYACFTRPEMKVERVSYDVITPSAARGIIESIYWKPAIKWVIDRITVLNPIEFGNIMINEVKSKTKKPPRDLSNVDGDNLVIFTKDDIAQRRMMYLKSVDYIVEAHFKPTGIGDDTNDSKKHYNIALRRMKDGQCYKQPCLGLRDFSANFRWVDEGEVITSKLKGERDLGFMLYDLEFKYKNGEALNDANPIFYRPIMKDGVIDVAKCYGEGVYE
ncbi:MAG: type I-C CRISPR-associated protein Cas5c [Eubacteriales bacterium]|nr:type I-C CRISPR-associated protein Cas5c [Eubacteriales bacterium]